MTVFITLLHKARYHVFLVVIRLIRTLPYPSILALFRFLALLAWIVDPFHRRIARTQIHAALDVPNVERLVMKVFMKRESSWWTRSGTPFSAIPRSEKGSWWRAKNTWTRPLQAAGAS